MSRQVSRGSVGEYQADERAGVARLSWRVSGRQPTPVLLPGEPQRQRIQADYSPWGRKESDTTERLTLSLFKGILSSLRSQFLPDVSTAQWASGVKRSSL